MPTDRNGRFYVQLFLRTLKLSAFTFGGGYVILTLMKKEFADKLGWIDTQKILDYTVIAQSAPGAIAVNASLLLGYQMAGLAGAAITVVATVLPPLVLLTALAYVYAAVQDYILIQYALKGLQAGVCAVIFDMVITLMQTVLRTKTGWRLGGAASLMTAAFLASAYLAVNSVWILLVGALLGYALCGVNGGRHDLS